MDVLNKRLANLLSVKSITTILLTILMCYMAITDRVTGDQVMVIYTSVVAFYFGTQSQKIQDQLDKET